MLVIWISQEEGEFPTVVGMHYWYVNVACIKNFILLASQTCIHNSFAHKSRKCPGLFPCS
jgi:hypothetical protein